MKTDIYIEVGDKKTNSKMLIDMVKEIWKSEGNRVKDLCNVELYYKPEENTCYYVINSDLKGFFVL